VICTSMGKHTLAWMLLAFMIPVAALAILHDGNGTAAAASPNDISVSVSISKRTLTTGETAVLSVTVEGTADCDAPEIPSVKDLDIRYSGPSSQVYIADGKVRQSISFRFIVRPSKTGTYTIPSIRVRVGDQTYSTDSIEIEVLSAAQAQAGPDSQTGPDGLPLNSLRLAVQPEKTTVYPGEEIRIRVILYIDGVRLTEVTYPRLEGRGFLCGEFSQPVQSRRDLEGRTYQTLEFEAVISPVSAGRLSLGPVSMDCEVSLPAQSSRSLFDEFFAGDFSSFSSFFDSPILGTQRKRVTVTSDPVDLVAKPFPDEGRPASFKGAVGDFTVSASATPTTVKAGDPISLRIEVSGRGNMRSVNPPVIQESEGMKTYEPTVLSSTASQKVFEQVIVVRDPEISAIPPVELAYFHPSTEQYRIDGSPPIPIVVTGPAQAESLSSEAQLQRRGGPAASESPQSEDGLLYIKRAPGTLVPLDGLSRPSLAATLAAAAGSLALAAALSWSFLQGRIEMRNSGRRQARLHRDAQKAISRLLSEVTSANAYEVIEEARKVVISCLGPARQATIRGAADALSKATAAAREATGSASLPSADDILQHLDRLRYSPTTPTADEIREVLSLCNQAIERLSAEGEKSSHRRTPSPSILMLTVFTALALSWGQVCIASADEVALECFYRGNAHYQSGQYDLAIASYEEAIERGSVSGNLLYNLGNAYAKTGRYGEAILSYVRASELIPRDRDLLHNMEAVSSILGLADLRVSGGPLAEGPGSDVLARIARTFTQSEWIFAAAVAYSVLSLMIVLRVQARGRARPPLLAILVIGCLFVVATSGALYRRSLFLGDPRAVVIAEEAPVRFEPDPSAPVRYRVSAGHILSTVDESNPGYLMVQNSAGQTGWIERLAVSPVKFRPR
jgi:tetratricopeptide (TPR) repeat protein